jgi:integrase
VPPRSRNSFDGLPGRVHPKHGAYYFVGVAPDGTRKWERLCRINEGKAKMFERLAEILDKGKKIGNMPRWINEYKRTQLNDLAFETRKIYDAYYDVIAESFEEFDVQSVWPAHIAEFLEHYADRPRTAQAYKARFTAFFIWCCEPKQSLRKDNPTREVKIAKPKKRKRYITHEEYHSIRNAMLAGANGRRTPAGEMMQCAMDLIYLTAQRSTEIRLLQLNHIKDGLIYFKPTKTEDSSEKDAFIPVTPEIQAILDRAKTVYSARRAKDRVTSMFVIHTHDGQRYTAHGLGSNWDRACERAGVKNATLKDLRAKALTDAKKLGYHMEDIQVAAAHSDAKTTEGYIKDRITPVSNIRLPMPPESGA